MITPLLKVTQRGGVEHLREVNHHPLCESHKPCMKMRKNQNEKIIYLTILRLLIRGPNGVNHVNLQSSPPVAFIAAFINFQARA